MVPLLYKILKAVEEVIKGLFGMSQTEARIEAKVDALSASVKKLEEELAAMAVLLNEILIAITPSPAVRLRVDVVLEGVIQIGVESVTITDTQKFTVSVAPLDGKGNPAVLDGPVSFTADNPALVTITPGADGLSAEVLAVGPLGSTQITISGDADLGAGVETITATLQVDVIAGKAASFAVNTSEAVEQ